MRGTREDTARAKVQYCIGERDSESLRSLRRELVSENWRILIRVIIMELDVSEPEESVSVATFVQRDHILVNLLFNNARVVTS